ncbi:GGDEF domain-containing protein [Deinococcus sedimenti]|nr:GGDEF domain-containing protein [Deinococcus sedimenti]
MTLPAAAPLPSEEWSALLPPALQPYEARLSPERSLARVDGLLQLVTEPHPLQDRVDLALAARDLAAFLNDAERQAGANFHLAHLLDSAEGLAAARLAASQYEHLRDPERERQSLYRVAQLAPDPREALVAAVQATELARDALDGALEEQALRRSAALLMDLEDHAGALGAARAALALAGEDAARQHASLPLLLLLGDLHLRAGDAVEALAAFRAAAYLVNGQGTAEQAEALGGVGRAYLAQGDLERAGKFLEKATEVARDLDAPALHARLLNALAAAQTDPGRVSPILKGSLALTGDAPRLHGETLLRLGQHAQGHGQTREAREAFLEAASVGQASGDAINEAEAHAGLAALALAQGNAEAAVPALRRWGELQASAREAQLGAQRRVQDALRDAQHGLALRRERREARDTLDSAMDQASAQLQELQQLVSRWRGTSMLDPDSGARSREYGVDLLRQHFRRSERTRAPLSLAVVAVEFPGAHSDVKDTLLESNVMTAVARLLQRSVRDTDTVARFDQFKFMVVLPDTDVAGARVAMERVLLGVTQEDWAAQGLTSPATLAVGLAARGFIQGVEQMIDVADAEQYRARRQGPDTLSVAC